jgi:hypothetical protein
MRPTDGLPSPIAGISGSFAVIGYHVAGPVSIKAAGSETGWAAMFWRHDLGIVRNTGERMDRDTKLT